MQKLVPVLFVALLSAGILGAGSPPTREEARRPLPEVPNVATLPTFVGSASEAAPEAEAPETSSVFVLPGAAATPEHTVSLPPPVPAATTVRSLPATQPDPEDRPPVLRRAPKLPEDMEVDAALFLQQRLGYWTKGDAAALMGEPVRRRVAFDSDNRPDGTIFAFADPSKRYREFELDFDRTSGKLRSVFVYPWKMKWEECRRLWGDKAVASTATNGRKFYSYEDRRLDVLVDRAGTVISLGLY